MVDLALSQLLWVDWAILIVTFLGIVYGMSKGMMREIAEIFETAVVLYVVLEYYPRIADFLLPHAGNTLAAYVPLAAFVAVTLAVVTVVLFVDGLLRKILATTLLAPVRTLGGALLGCVHALMFLAVIAQALTLVPVAKIQGAFVQGGSVLGPYVLQLAPRVHAIAAQVVSLLR